MESQGEEEEEGDDDCFGKSKRQCNGNSECMYDNFGGVCIPRENVNHGDGEAGEGLRALTPPSPDSAPSTPKGWNEMKRVALGCTSVVHVCSHCLIGWF